MAQFMSPVVPSKPLQIQSTVTRSNSITSTNSANSAVSLRRRSRTRTRALTNTGRRGKSIGPIPTSSSDGGEGADTGVVGQLALPPLPTRSSRRSGVSPSRPILVSQELTVPSPRERTYSAVHIREVPAEASRGRQTRSEGGSTRSLKAKSRGVSLPRSAFRTVASSDESSQGSPRTPTDSPVAPFAHRTSRPFRDSVASSSSSLYPPSTSTESYPESASLQSLSGKDDDISSFSPRIVTRENSSDFDVDDVSYRLRLLVNNSYFLPPAHSKPSPLSLSPQNAHQAQKDAKAAAASTFLDFFRMGKSKSKPITPINRISSDPDAPAPVLRTTSDSTTASGYAPRTQPSTHTPASQQFAMAHSNQSRVVVLRERMDDLEAAAKQAERDIKSRGDGRKANSLTSPKANAFFDDIIDPTDAVDLPPLAAGYPFAVQASALHGLGPGESLGADLLAVRLPPSPGMWSMSSEEESWRKALLQEAVSLSLSDSPDQSFTSATPSSPSEVTSPKSFRSQEDTRLEEPASPPTPKALPLIGQRIIEPLKLDTAAEEAVALSPLSALQPLPSPSLSGRLSMEQVDSQWRRSLIPPRRADSPQVTLPLTPPPPRRELARMKHSMSSTELSRPPTAASERASDTLQILRRAVSSPRLSAVDDYQWSTGSVTTLPESISQRMLSMSPPAVDIAARESQSSLTRPSISSILRSSPFSEDDDISYRTPMDDIDGDSRPSMTLSIPTVGRPSLSDYSNPSPTASAFQDALFGSCRSPSPLLLRRNHPGAISPPPSASASTPASALPRHIAVSPPPRTSSSLGNTVLPPPPRSPAVKPVYCSSTSSGASMRSASSYSSTPVYSAMEQGFDTASEMPSPVQASAPRSRSPSLSLAERRGQISLLSLQIPTATITPAIHSAPAPASPTAFFDRIQSHPNAMDDLETSDESDEDDVAARVEPPARKSDIFPAPRGTSIRSSSSGSIQPSFMRLGNHSSPHLASSSNHEDSVPAFDVPDRKKPIGNVPEKGTFFTTRSRKKSAKGQNAAPLTPIEGSAAASDNASAGPSRPARSYSTSRRPATSGGTEQKVRTWQRESLQKFDGMLLEHMAAERDTIKRITSNLSNSRS